MVASTLGRRDGLAVAVTLPLLLVLSAFLAATLVLAREGLRHSARQTAVHQSLYVADGGLHNAMARLHGERQAAATSLTYAATGAGSIHGNPFEYAISQDPMFPADPTRKQIVATGRVAGTQQTLVSQVQVFAYGGGNSAPTCDWALFADRGTARLLTNAAAASRLLDGDVHSNNELHLKAIAAAAVAARGRFQSVGTAVAESTAAILSTLEAELYRGGPLVMRGTHVHAPLTEMPLFGIHFANGIRNHGVQQTVSRIAFPVADWKGLAQTPGVTIVNAESVPFGSWDQATDTWVVSTQAILPSETQTVYFVQGNVRIADLVLARASNARIAAEGSIEIEQLSVLQAATGTRLPVTLNSTQRLRLLAKRNVFVGRGLLQPEADALGDASRAGLNLSTGLPPIRNQIAAYSGMGDVWMKSTSISLGAATELSLLGSGDSTFAVTGSLVSSPRTFCQPILL